MYELNCDVIVADARMCVDGFIRRLLIYLLYIVCVFKAL